MLVLKRFSLCNQCRMCVCVVNFALSYIIKGFALVKKVILKRTTEPAANKWTKMDPAFSQTTLQECFYEVGRALQF